MVHEFRAHNCPLQAPPPICILSIHSSTHSHLKMSDAEFPIVPPPLLSPEKWLASLKSSMSTLVTTSQSTAAALACVLALLDLAPMTTLLLAAPAVVQAATSSIPLPMDLASLPAFLKSYKVQVVADTKVETRPGTL
ncbi:hypothetical protein DXG03_002511, partial [Asterophora parasitica]